MPDGGGLITQDANSLAFEKGKVFFRLLGAGKNMFFLVIGNGKNVFFFVVSCCGAAGHQTNKHLQVYDRRDKAH